MIAPTGSQTVGPFFSIGLDYLTVDGCKSECRPENVLLITGTIFDGNDVPVPDAQLELWRADVDGRYATSVPSHRGKGPATFDGFTRVATNDGGGFAFQTILPGRVRGPQSSINAPHIVAAIFMRGLLLPLYTRIYFAGLATNDSDPVLSLVPRERQSTLLAAPQENSPRCYRWDVHLQGSKETVFFTY
jgi:protocatechuate 3,4-dioxygenase alpha subunit